MSGFRQIKVLFFLWSLPFIASAQIGMEDTTFTLPGIEVRAGRLLGHDATDNTVTLDSTARIGMIQGQLGDVLGALTPVTIKQYGPSGIGSSSIRGGSAAQTSVLWNGFPLANPMLAQSDLSLLPAPLIDAVSLTYGSGSALWGSGAVGGVVALENKMRFNEGFLAEAGIGWGSFRQQQQHLRLAHSGAQSATQVRAFRRQARNDFTYTDLFGESRTLDHARTAQVGATLSQSFRSGNHQWTAHTWWHHADRQIPPTRVQAQSVAEQEDASLRLALNYSYQTNQWQINARAARFSDRLAYRDSLLDLSTNSRATSYWGELLGGYRPSANHKVEMGIQLNDQTGTSEAYRQPGQRQTWSWLGRYRWYPTQGWVLSMRIRQAWADGRRLPLVPYLGVRGKLNPWLTLRANVNRSYRLPGLDDLYWTPGGNPNLLPEAGWGQEIGLRAARTRKQLSIRGSITAFSRHIDNWIQWVPGNSYWSPRNVREVWSRGLEHDITLGWRTADWSASLHAFYHYIRSTDESDSGQQLIYVPRHQAGAQLRVDADVWFVRYNHRYSSRSYTVADHSGVLMDWHRADLYVGCHWQIAGLAGQLQAGVINVWNADYELVVNRPLPGRHLHVNLIFKWTDHEKNK